MNKLQLRKILLLVCVFGMGLAGCDQMKPETLNNRSRFGGGDLECVNKNDCKPKPTTDPKPTPDPEEFKCPTLENKFNNSAKIGGTPFSNQDYPSICCHVREHALLPEICLNFKRPK
jgi:hypothetical protein